MTTTEDNPLILCSIPVNLCTAISRIIHTAEWLFHVRYQFCTNPIPAALEKRNSQIHSWFVPCQ